MAVDGSEIPLTLRVVPFPVTYRVLYIPGGWLFGISEASTVITRVTKKSNMDTEGEQKTFPRIEHLVRILFNVWMIVTNDGKPYCEFTILVLWNTPRNPIFYNIFGSSCRSLWGQTTWDWSSEVVFSWKDAPLRASEKMTAEVWNSHFKVNCGKKTSYLKLNIYQT